jgi:hypothetical protein
VNGARDAVVHCNVFESNSIILDSMLLTLEVHLRHSVLGVDGGIRDVTCPQSQLEGSSQKLDSPKRTQHNGW